MGCFINCIAISLSELCNVYKNIIECVCHPALVAQLVARWPADIRVAGSIAGRGCQQCCGGKRCSHVLSFTRDLKLWALCIKISPHVEVPSGGQNYQQPYPAASHSAFCNINPPSAIKLSQPHPSFLQCFFIIRAFVRLGIRLSRSGWTEKKIILETCLENLVGIHFFLRFYKSVHSRYIPGCFVVCLQMTMKTVHLKFP